MATFFLEVFELMIYQTLFTLSCRASTHFPWMHLQRQVLLLCAEQRGGTWKGKKKNKLTSLFFNLEELLL